MHSRHPAAYHDHLGEACATPLGRKNVNLNAWPSSSVIIGGCTRAGLLHAHDLCTHGARAVLANAVCGGAARWAGIIAWRPPTKGMFCHRRNRLSCRCRRAESCLRTGRDVYIAWMGDALNRRPSAAAKDLRKAASVLICPGEQKCAKARCQADNLGAKPRADPGDNESSERLWTFEDSATLALIAGAHLIGHLRKAKRVILDSSGQDAEGSDVDMAVDYDPRCFGNFTSERRRRAQA